MKQKYSIFKDNETGTMTIKESAELEKGLFSLVFEETYDNEMVQAAIKEGKAALISVIRKPDLYPIAEYAEKIADTIIEYFEKAPAEEPVELVFNDIQLMQKEKKEIPEAEEEKSVEIDDLLDDDSDDSEKDGDTPKKDSNSSNKEKKTDD
ncbi:MAG: hypothetical protein KAH06_00820 [Desulfobacterales bacterium]|nr:hypothetical protein [Desulfobacterales bacterium]